MALVVFLRGVNVGGHKTFKPKQLAEQLKHLDVVNIGAAGTFIVRKAVSPAKVRAEIAKRMPFEVQIAVCEGRDIQRLVAMEPFGFKPAAADITRFVTVLMDHATSPPEGPQRWPRTGPWMVKVHAVEGRFVLGEYRRNMKTISYLGGLDKAYGNTTTTRNWNTINTIAKKLSI
jgi:uncharacterized protein (DUF1697 family)